jgi:hypothetical protein
MTNDDENAAIVRHARKGMSGQLRTSSNELIEYPPLMAKNTLPDERGGPAKRPGNPGPHEAPHVGPPSALGNGSREEKIAKMEKVRERQPKLTHGGRFEEVEKSGNYRKAYAGGIKKGIQSALIRGSAARGE